MKREPPGAAALLVRALRELLLAPVRVYRKVISPALPARCKYYPSCSSYAVEAVRELGVVRGFLTAADRLARCNPWSDGGVDELADRRIFRAGAPPGGRAHEHGAAT